MVNITDKDLPDKIRYCQVWLREWVIYWGCVLLFMCTPLPLVVSLIAIGMSIMGMHINMNWLIGAEIVALIVGVFIVLPDIIELYQKNKDDLTQLKEDWKELNGKRR